MEFRQESKLRLKGKHNAFKLNRDLNMLSFEYCDFNMIPNLTKIFKNLKVLEIKNSNLESLTKDDLESYKNLEVIDISYCGLKFLTGDLFDGFVNLREIYFDHNELEEIEPNILNGLGKLLVADFQDNTNYNHMYNYYKMNNRDFKKFLLDIFIEAHPDDTAMRLECLLDANLQLNMENKIYCENFYQVSLDYLNYKRDNDNSCKGMLIERYKVEIQELKDEVKQLSKYKAGVYFYLEKLIQDDTKKDFKIIIDNCEFPVHKFLLVARSPTLAEILKRKPEAKNLKLLEISVEIFEIILKFLYTDKLPGVDEANFLHLFAAAGKLKIKELEEHCAIELIGIIDENNAIEVLKLSNKYGHEDLSKMAFYEIQIKYPGVIFKDKLYKNVNDLEKFIEIVNRKDEADRLMKEFFEQH